jgi:hypothetical protein
MSGDADFTTWLALADHLAGIAIRDQLAETARLLALNLAHYQLRFGEAPLEHFEERLRTQTMDPETARLGAKGMENLLDVFGYVSQDETTNDTIQ